MGNIRLSFDKACACCTAAGALAASELFEPESFIAQFEHEMIAIEHSKA